MADLMQQARELLAAEYEKDSPDSFISERLRAGSALLWQSDDVAIRAIEAALRAAPEGFVLVPVVPTAAMERVLVDYLENNESSSDCYAAMLAARPQGVR